MVVFMWRLPSWIRQVWWKNTADRIFDYTPGRQVFSFGAGMARPISRGELLTFLGVIPNFEEKQVLSTAHHPIYEHSFFGGGDRWMSERSFDLFIWSLTSVAGFGSCSGGRPETPRTWKAAFFFCQARGETKLVFFVFREGFLSDIRKFGELQSLESAVESSNSFFFLFRACCQLNLKFQAILRVFSWVFHLVIRNKYLLLTKSQKMDLFWVKFYHRHSFPPPDIRRAMRIGRPSGPELSPRSQKAVPSRSFAFWRRAKNTWTTDISVGWVPIFDLHRLVLFRKNHGLMFGFVAKLNLYRDFVKQVVWKWRVPISFFCVYIVLPLVSRYDPRREDKGLCFKKRLEKIRGKNISYIVPMGYIEHLFFFEHLLWTTIYCMLT